jgi:nucleoside-diphosphate-sugar epimerase
MKAFVAGATGLTGRSVVEVLVTQGHEAVAHVRPDSPRLAEWRTRFDAMGARVDETPWEAAAIAGTLAREKPALIFGLLGTTRARASAAARAGRDPAKESYDAVDVAMTEMLIAGARALQPRPRFVYLSSVGAGEGARGAYLDARTRVEKTLAASGVPHVIARPSFIVGDRDEPRTAEKLGAPVADALLGVLGALGARTTADRYRSITGPALARALVRAALEPTGADRVLEPDALQALARG